MQNSSRVWHYWQVTLVAQWQCFKQCHNGLLSQGLWQASKQSHCWPHNSCPVCRAYLWSRKQGVFLYDLCSMSYMTWTARLSFITSSKRHKPAIVASARMTTIHGWKMTMKMSWIVRNKTCWRSYLQRLRTLKRMQLLMIYWQRWWASRLCTLRIRRFIYSSPNTFESTPL